MPAIEHALNHAVIDASTRPSRGPAVACLGETFVECPLFLPALPLPNETLIRDGVTSRMGGPALNMALHLSSLGHRTCLGSVAGQWDEPALNRAVHLAGLSLAEIAWGDSNSDSLVYFKTPRSFRAVYQRAPLPTDVEQRLHNASLGCKVLVLAGSRHQRIRRVYAEVLRTTTARWRIFAPNYAVYSYSRDELRTAINGSNVVCLNKDEARHVCRSLGLANLWHIGLDGNAAVLVTSAGRGATLHLLGVAHKLSAASGQRGDVVGAGDAFAAGMVHGLLSGLDLLAAAGRGAEAAANFVRAPSSSWPLLGKLPAAHFATQRSNV